MSRCIVAMLCGGFITVMVLLVMSFIGDSDPNSSPEPERQIDGLSMNDPRLVSHLTDRWLISPPASLVPLALADSYSNDISKHKQATNVSLILGYMKRGFFVEYGSQSSGELSNSLLFEKLYGWTGLLIENNQTKFYDLVLRRRKVFISPSCVSETTLATPGPWNNATLRSNQCFPLYSYLLALDRSTVDYLSLDTDGDVLKILRTIPWHMVDIRVISVDCANDSALTQHLTSYLTKKGFLLNSKLIHTRHTSASLIFSKLLR